MSKLLNKYKGEDLAAKTGEIFTGTKRAAKGTAVGLSRTFSHFKAILISKLFWGRNSLYKNITHLVIVFITITIAVLGLLNRLEASANNIASGDNISGLNDLLLQGGSIQTVLVSNQAGLGVNTRSYTVLAGDNLDTIAKKFNLKSADTIKWANLKELSIETLLTGRLDTGTILLIPEIDGVLYEVRNGDTLDSIIATASVTNDEANRSNIIQFNNLPEPYVLKTGDKIFIPEGNLTANGIGALAEIPRGVFMNPLAHESCAGYSWSRGFSWYHNGVDLAKFPFCPVSAIASGIVVYAGWSSAGEGYNVRIDHGGGITSHYYHGDGEIWVKTGDRVQQGQLIMMTGSSGNSTGPHLHFSLFKDNVAVDPEPYVPY